ncbi:MAG: hypothetical protein Q9172_003534 [Xanthocarpia lactea]
MSEVFEGYDCAIGLSDMYAPECWGGGTQKAVLHEGEPSLEPDAGIRNMLGHYDAIKVLDSIDDWRTHKVIQQLTGSTKPQILGQSLRAHPSQDLSFLRRLQALHKAKQDGCTKAWTGDRGSLTSLIDSPETFNDSNPCSSLAVPLDFVRSTGCTHGPLSSYPTPLKKLKNSMAS